MAMAVPPEVVKEVENLLSPSCPAGINTRLQKVLSILEGVGLVYKANICPSSMLCHPENRGRSLINPFNAHRKGAEILDSGLKADLLPPNSLAIEISRDVAKKDSQLGANKRMVDEAGGLLASVRGDERFLTLANSHFVQWAKAMELGCKKPDGSQMVLSVDMKPLLTEGWQWQVISHEAEQIWPTLPGFASMAMNSHNTNQIASNELECMLQLAALYEEGLKLDDAVLAVQHAAPSCKKYLGDVAYFCRMFSGGKKFPLLLCLDHLCTTACTVRFAQSFSGLLKKHI